MKHLQRYFQHHANAEFALRVTLAASLSILIAHLLSLNIFIVGQIGLFLSLSMIGRNYAERWRNFMFCVITYLALLPLINFVLPHFTLVIVCIMLLTFFGYLLTYFSESYAMFCVLPCLYFVLSLNGHKQALGSYPSLLISVLVGATVVSLICLIITPNKNPQTLLPGAKHGYAWRRALRMSLVIVIGLCIAKSLNSSFLGWVALSSYLMSQGTMAASFKRFWQRVAGTIVGLIVSTLLYYFLPNVFFALLYALPVLLFLICITMRQHYDIASFLITITVILVFALLPSFAQHPMSFIGQRAIDTLLGGVILLLAEMLIFPISVIRVSILQLCKYYASLEIMFTEMEKQCPDTTLVDAELEKQSQMPTLLQNIEAAYKYEPLHLLNQRMFFLHNVTGLLQNMNDHIHKVIEQRRAKIISDENANHAFCLSKKIFRLNRELLASKHSYRAYSDADKQHYEAILSELAQEAEQVVAEHPYTKALLDDLQAILKLQLQALCLPRYRLPFRQSASQT